MNPENTYIMNLEACYIYKDITENKKIQSANKDPIKLFSATIPYSLETIRMNELFPKTFYEENRKQYTKSIINLKFDKHYTKWNEEIKKKSILANKNKIRKYFYKNGFELDGIKYVFYKRGAGKAKNGYAFYIKENMKEVLLDRSRLGIKFEQDEELDLTSIHAYESLITSGIEFTIDLDPHTEILLIDDINGKEFESYASVTEDIEGEIVTKNRYIMLQNCLTDGQGLLDESVFNTYRKASRGFMLLRNDMFKCCAFNTKLKQWFEHNNITEAVDIFGRKYDSSKIKLVITPNSLKFLKFSYKIGDKSKSNAYKYWINNINSIFGVVKCDKTGNYGNYNRVTYQLLNSIPTLTYEDLMELTKTEREYVMFLKNENVVFMNYLGCGIKDNLFLDGVENEDISLYENKDLMNALLLVNSDIQYIPKFKKLKRDLISNYIGHLKRGKIRIKDTKYVTLFSNPYEMLLATIGKYNGESIMKGREVYCKYYKDGQDFCASRNPHINAGNIMYTTNKHHKEYDLWFNLTDNICAINFFDNDAPDRLQGCDTDSDTLLLIPHNILSQKAIYCEDTFPTPINRVKGVSKLKKYNMNELCKIDSVLSNNYIGKIVNMSQIINSYLSDAMHNKESWSVIEDLYSASSRLSSLSQIEIDKSKKVFDNVNMRKELNKIRNIKHIKYVQDKDSRGTIVDKMVVPIFFNMISDSDEFRVFTKFNTPLDILQDVLKFKRGKKHKKERQLELVDLLIKSKHLNGQYEKDSADAIFKVIEECGKKMIGLRVKSCKLNDFIKNSIKQRLKIVAVEKLKKLNPNDSTILYILKQAFSNIESDIGFKKYGMLTLNLLFISKKLQVLKCFRKQNTELDKILIKTNNSYDFDIFGEKYKSSFKKNIL